MKNEDFTTKGSLSDHVISHDGYQREYIIYQPSEISKIKSVPLLFVLHGGSGTNEGMMRLTKNRFNELADIHKFYVVYPQGLEKGWNDGRNDLKQFSSENNIDDVGFFKKLIYTLQSEYNTDDKKVFVTGISNGGFMSFRLGCELRNEISAIAPVTATIAEDALKYCRGKSTVSLALFNGTNDPIVPYAGGEVTILRKRRGKIISTDDTISHWRNMLGCSIEHTTKEIDTAKQDGTTVTIFNYDQCRSNSKINLYRINGGGHTWPGGKSYLTKRLVGITSQDINTCDEVWEFFSTFAN